MSDLKAAAQQALETLEANQYAVANEAPHIDVMAYNAAITALRAALAQPEPVIDRAMAVRIATQLGWVPPQPEHKSHCALLQIPSRECDCGEEPALSRCPQCGGPADNGHDRSIPPSPYWCTKCMAEPVQEPVAWYLPSPDGDDSIFRDHRTVIACTGNKWEGFQPLYTAPPRCPNCASLEEQNAELDRKLAELERAEPVATTQQPVEQTPPSEYRRGYWDGFAVGKREGRIEAEDAAKRAEHNPTCALLQIPSRECDCSAEMAPVQRPMHPELRKMWEDYFDKCFRAMPAPPQRKPLALTDLQEALVYTNLIDRDAIDNPEEYDDGSTLAQVDELHSIIKERV